MAHRIEVMGKKDLDFASERVTRNPIKVYSIEDTLTDDEMVKVVELLRDPIVEDVSVDMPILEDLPMRVPYGVVIEKSSKLGVTDAPGERTRAVISRKLGRKIGQISTSFQYFMNTPMDENAFAGFKKTNGSI